MIEYKNQESSEEASNAICKLIKEKYDFKQELKAANAKIERLYAANRGLREALEFYAEPKSPCDNWPKGTRIEFGCSCCAGIIEEDNVSVDFDKDVCGLTAREALARYPESEDGNA